MAAVTTDPGTAGTRVIDANVDTWVRGRDSKDGTPGKWTCDRRSTTRTFANMLANFGPLRTPKAAKDPDGTVA